MDQSLLKQLAEALPNIYLMTYRNRDSEFVDKSIKDTLEELFKTYGAIPEEEIEGKERDLESRIFDIIEPIVNLFNTNEELQKVNCRRITLYQSIIYHQVIKVNKIWE